MDDALAAHLQALERALHDPVVRGDVAQLAALLDDDFSEIGSSGVCFDRAAALAEIPRERAQVEIVSTDYDCVLLVPTLAQVRYRSWCVIDGERPSARCCAVRCGAGTARHGGWCFIRARPRRLERQHRWRENRAPKKVAAPPADLGARVDRYRCCLPALAGFST